MRHVAYFAFLLPLLGFVPRSAAPPALAQPAAKTKDDTKKPLPDLPLFLLYALEHLQEPLPASAQRGLNTRRHLAYRKTILNNIGLYLERERRNPSSKVQVSD